MESGILIFFFICLAAETICNAKRVLQNVEQSTMPISDSTIAASQSRQHWTHAHGPEFAGIILKGAFHQVHANIRIDKPDVDDHHRSGAYISIESGVDDIYNKIQVGWIVHPDMYGDHDVHLYARWIGDNNTECFHHHHCPGFIATNTSQLTLGSKLDPSVVGRRPIKVLQLALTQDNCSGVWYLHGGPYLPTLGYWKTDYFASLTGVAGAVVARFGGEVFTPEDSNSSPPMGTGRFKNSNYAVTSYFDDIKANSEDPLREDLQVVETRCYFVSEVPGLVPNGFGFYFGGKGGKDMETCIY